MVQKRSSMPFTGGAEEEVPSRSTLLAIAERAAGGAR
jgi:hypothetical protein